MRDDNLNIKPQVRGDGSAAPASWTSSWLCFVCAQQQELLSEAHTDTLKKFILCRIFNKELPNGSFKEFYAHNRIVQSLTKDL